MLRIVLSPKAANNTRGISSTGPRSFVTAMLCSHPGSTTRNCTELGPTPLRDCAPGCGEYLIRITGEGTVNAATRDAVDPNKRRVPAPRRMRRLLAFSDTSAGGGLPYCLDTTKLHCQVVAVGTSPTAKPQYLHWQLSVPLDIL